jgi:DNA invertase Pin-like site-specific DNA recombinase
MVLVKNLKKMGVEVLFADAAVSEYMLMQAIEIAVADYEKALISERTKAALAKRKPIKAMHEHIVSEDAFRKAQQVELTKRKAKNK